MMEIGDRIQVALDKKEVCRYMGYGAGHKVSARISFLVDAQIESAYELIEPAYSCVVRDIEGVDGRRVFVGDSVVFDSQVIAELLGQCHEVAAFLATIGGRLEKRVRAFAKEGRVLEATILDAAGSEAAEKVAGALEDRIGEIACAQGLGISMRYSPGYCDWDIAQQRELFRAMNGESVGIHLTDGLLMVPRKSISGIIGIGPFNGELKDYSPCQTCDKLDCQSRR